MKASDKYKEIFGEIKSLNDHVSWTSGLSNMMEYFLWETRNVLGISKTDFAKFIVSLSDRAEFREAGQDERWAFVETQLKLLGDASDTVKRYAKPKYSYCTPREALRRARFFSEDYLNKQFDIFLCLCSDGYLDNLYRAFGLEVSGGGQWSTHGNSGLFSESVGFSELRMQMDNLAYNDKEDAAIDPGKEIDLEAAYCSQAKKDLRFLCEENNLRRASRMTLKQITWHDIIRFNEEYARSLSPEKQVEQKLLSGFNAALREKDFMNRASE